MGIYGTLRRPRPESLKVEARRKLLTDTRISLLLGLFFLAAAVFLDTSAARSDGSSVFQAAEEASFTSWRPYNNPNRLISLGMNKGEVIALAGKPEHEESYYRSTSGRLFRITDWYYFRTGDNPETTLLKFVQESLVSIISTPTQ